MRSRSPIWRAIRHELVEITQVLGPNQIGEKPILPSALYIPHPDEFPENTFPLPWANGADQRAIVGAFARDHGALVPDRLVTSAKSWLSNPHIDPKQPVLPWNSDVEDEAVGVRVSRGAILSICAKACSMPNAGNSGSWDLAEGQIVLTVPASFDEVARNLTAEAAEAAGLGKVILLEEPLAAFYAWTAQAGKEWRSQVGSRRHRARLRCRRRHGRLQPDRGDRTGRQLWSWSGSASASTSCSAATTWTGARLCAAGQARGRGQHHRCAGSSSLSSMRPRTPR